MKKINVICKAIFLKNILRSIIMYLILLILFSVFLFTMNNLSKDNVNNFLPKDMLYVELRSQGLEDDFLEATESEKVEVYKTLPVLFNKKSPIDTSTYNSSLEINLEEMIYSKEAPVDLAESNQHKIAKGQEIENPKVSYNFVNKVVNEEGIRLPNQNYNIKEILVGEYPKTTDEVLIGENMANYYLNEKNLNTYKDLLGQEINIKTVGCNKEILCVDDSYKISGVYRGNYNNDENFIINPNEEIQNLFFEKYQNVSLAYFVKSSDNKKLEDIENLKYYSFVLTPQYVNSPNVYNMIFVICVIIFNIVIFINYYRRIKYLNDLLNYYGMNKYLSKTIYVLPLLVLIILLIFIYFIIFTWLI